MCNHNADTCTATRCLPWKILICKCQPRKGRKGTAGCRGDKTGPEREGDERTPPQPPGGHLCPGAAGAQACARPPGGEPPRGRTGARVPPARPQPPRTPSAERAARLHQHLCRMDPPPLLHMGPPPAHMGPPCAHGTLSMHTGPPCAHGTPLRTWHPAPSPYGARVARTPAPAAGHEDPPPRAAPQPVPPTRGTAPCPRPRGEAAGSRGFWRQPRLGAACQRLQSPRRAALQPCLLFPGSVPLREPPAPGVVPD